MAQSDGPSESRGFRHARGFEPRAKLTKLQTRLTCKRAPPLCSRI